MNRINIYDNYSKKEILAVAESLILDHSFTKNISLLVSAYKNNFVHYHSIHSSQASINLLNRAILKNNNIIRKLGSGGFSFVYEGIDNLVYKISISNEHEDAWLLYARISKKTKNPLFPVIHQLSVYGDDYCCKMEKLNKVKVHLKDGLLKTISNSILVNDLAGSINMINTIGIVYYDNYVNWSAKLTKIINNNDHLFFDFHKNNIMLRGENLVITDPLS